ncbi:MAG: hypothetical protein J0H64_00505, partial [Actinobacteria bacterium]|nr:hypothetical protein [Actinomycetota bacterium]
EHARKIDVIRTDGSLITRVGVNLFTTSNCTVVVPPGPPLRPRISPDSMKIAYYQVRGVNCGSGIRVESLTGVVHTTTGGLAGSILLGPHPSWVTNSRLVLRDVALGDVGPGQAANYWFRDSDVLNTDDYGFFRDVTEPAVSRSGTRVGFVLSNFDRAFILPTQGDPRTGASAKPTRGTGCVFTSNLTRTDPNTPLVDSLSFTADGSTAILRDGPDIKAVEIPDIGNCGAGAITTLVKNATDPFWSPAVYAVPRPVVLKNTATPKISGTAKVGKKLTAKRGSWSGAPTSYSYQWYRGSKKIAKATKSSYRLKSADRGKKIRVKITAKRAGSASRTVYSKYTAKVRR